MPRTNNKETIRHERHRAKHLVDTETTECQEETENECKPFFVDLTQLNPREVAHLQNVGLLVRNDRHEDEESLSLNDNDDVVCLLHEKHGQYLSMAFGNLSSGFCSLDSSRPWMLYWTLHGCDLVGQLPNDDNVLIKIVDTIQTCWQWTSPSTAGGFGGGPLQLAHCAPTYAAVLTLCIIATTTTNAAASKRALDYLETIRIPLREWFIKLKEPCGGFRMHFDGEIDVRASYTILSCATLLNILCDALVDDAVVQYICDCQTYEGGFGGEPGSEAHGGYTFCALAALQLLNHVSAVRVPDLRGWLVRRQMSYEGGFQGRCNKLVDGCYSFWQGGAIAIMSATDQNCRQSDPWLENDDLDTVMTKLEPLFTEALLQRYILLCAQEVGGGLRDKPSKPRDFYHTCYNLSGLSVSQHWGTLSYGHPLSSRVAKTHPVHNLRIDRAETIIKHFKAKN